MLSKILIISFKEFLEISLILSVIIAGTSQMMHRSKSIIFGSVLGVVFAVLMSVSIEYISNMFQGRGQEVLNIIFLSISLVTIIWTIVWVKKPKINLPKNQEQISFWSMVVIVSSLIFRELAEIILLSYGIIKSDPKLDVMSIIIDGSLGMCSALLLGYMLYRGFITISKKYLFLVTSVLMSFIAASIAVDIVNNLESIGVMYSFPAIWDTSWIISQGSVFGNILHNMFGYVDQPSIIQIAAYVSTLLFIRFIL